MGIAAPSGIEWERPGTGTKKPAYRKTKAGPIALASLIERLQADNQVGAFIR
jgi:hypothetical protein